jgi:glycerol kinase
MNDPLILAIDQGTTNTKALLVSGRGEIVTSTSFPMQVVYPKPGWAEQSAEHIWRTVVQAIAGSVAKAEGRPIAGLAISNQRESVIVWDAKTGEPIGPCVIWQCRRSSEACAALRAAGHEPEVVKRTGLGLDPMFPATKLAWLIDSVPGARRRAERGELRAGTVDSWLIWKLTGGVHATDHSNASRTQLFNLQTLAWDGELAELFGVPLRLLAEILPSDGEFGATAAQATALAAGTPICAVLGDSHAALYGHGFREPNRVKVTCGTGSSLMLVTPARVQSRHGLSSTIAWSKGPIVLHALEGNILVSGLAAAYVTRLLGLPDEAALTSLAQQVPSSDGVVFVPALAGLGAPHWRDSARGIISGMTLGTAPAHLARAVLEAIALQIRDVFTAMQSDLGAELPSIAVDGGASRNDFLMQMLADLLDRPVIRGACTEVSALGVARLAGEALGIWAADGERETTTFRPRMPASERQAIVSQWRDAIARAVFAPGAAGPTTTARSLDR